MKLIYVKDYYKSKGTRELAHKVKNGCSQSIKEMALELSELIPEGSILVPVPSSKGYATETLEIANIIAENKSIIVKDIVKGNKRRSLYYLKKEKKEVNDAFFSFKLIEQPPKETVFIIDTVYDTGQTFNALIKLIPNSICVAYTKS